MEILQPYLLEGERVLWIDNRTVNYAVRLPLVACGLGGIWALIAFFLWYIPTAAGNFSPSLYVTLLIVFAACICFAFYIAIRMFKKGLQVTGLTLADIKQYHEVFALTDKRWIQKEIMRILTVNPSQYPPSVLNRQKDVVTLSLSACDRAVVQPVQFRQRLSFFIQSPIRGGFALVFSIYLSKGAADSLLPRLRQILPVDVVSRRSSGQPLPHLHD